jgi:hypothetical protein
MNKAAGFLLAAVPAGRPVAGGWRQAWQASTRTGENADQSVPGRFARGDGISQIAHDLRVTEGSVLTLEPLGT